jgi:BirA family biotin operon repressor/biotin-[acetyl-CoA-carboxylase] ligase
MSSSSPFTGAPLPAPESFAGLLRQELPGWHVAWLAATASTNADAQQHLRAGLGAPVLIGAHEQSAGRGRAGRSWQTRPGDALLFSCGWTVDIAPAALPPLSLVAGAAVCDALAELLGTDAADLSLKWPNDIQWRGAKLAGILVETVPAPGRRIGIVIGMGLNLRGGAELSRALDRAVADWGQTGTLAAPNALVSAAARAWDAAIGQYARDGFAALKPRFERWDALRGQAVRVIEGDQVLRVGTSRGVDDHGRILVEDAGGIHAVTVGDISVRAAT